MEEAPGRVRALLLLLLGRCWAAAVSCCALPAIHCNRVTSTADADVWEVELSQSRRPSGDLTCSMFLHNPL